ncbi:MAG: NifB/NifX family molybdenum-iron cluster-binding protein, partial [Candidatus Omnitrophica bacterium]|nr:NifB/NifX family molybdenum-iron cluster-binding protein [Candidatus Omnitrophota bacterium]
FHKYSFLSPVDPRFGRAQHLLLVDSDSGKVEVYDNREGIQTIQGAGTQTAQRVVDLGAEAVITGHVGPNALAVLQAAGVKIYSVSGGTASDAINRWKAGQLQSR